MKVRNDFVSNSSSASFIISREEHGCWYNQAIGILNKLNNEWFDKIDIAFDDTVDYIKFMDNFKLMDTAQNNECSGKYFSMAIRRNGYIKFKPYEKLIWISTNDVNFINKMPVDYRDHILYMSVQLLDECDIGRASTGILYKMLKNTGLKFDWDR